MSETGFDVHRNIGESLSEIILKNKRPKSSTKYQNTLINHWLNMWFALSQCLKINPCERSSLDDVLRALTNNMVPYIKSLPISQASVLECVAAEIAAGNTNEVPSNEGTNSCTFLSLKSMIELFKRKKLETIRIQDLLEEIAVETILKYPEQINQYRDTSSQCHSYKALEIMKKQDSSLDLFDSKYHLHSGYLALSEEGMLELSGKLSDIREMTKDQLLPATYVCPPYTVSLGIFRQKFFLLDPHKVSSRNGGVGEGVVITTKQSINQSINRGNVCLALEKT